MNSRPPAGRSDYQPFSLPNDYRPNLSESDKIERKVGPTLPEIPMIRVKRSLLFLHHEAGPEKTRFVMVSGWRKRQNKAAGWLLSFCAFASGCQNLLVTPADTRPPSYLSQVPTPEDAATVKRASAPEQDLHAPR